LRSNGDTKRVSQLQGEDKGSYILLESVGVIDIGPVDAYTPESATHGQ